MGGKGSGRLTKTEELIRSGKVQKQNPIAEDMFLPNHSGIAVHPEATKTFVEVTGDTMTGNLKLQNSGPVITFDNTTSGAESKVSATSSFGSLLLEADTQNAVANSSINMNIDGVNVGKFDESGNLQLDGLIDSDGIGTNTFAGNLSVTGTGAFTDSVSITKADTVALTIEDTSANGIAQLNLKNDVQHWQIKCDNGDNLEFVDITNSSAVPMRILPLAPSNSFRLEETEIVFNDNSADLNFRVETVNNPRIIFVDAGNDLLRLGTSSNSVDIETDGDVNFVGGGGLQFGEIWVKGNATALTLNSSAKVQVTIFDTDGVSNGSVTPDHTNDHITVGKEGMYFVSISISVANDASQSHQVNYGLFKNNGATQYENVHATRNLSGGSGDVGSVTLSGIIDCAANDTIELWHNTDSSSDRDVITQDATMSIMQIGGT